MARFYLQYSIKIFKGLLTLQAANIRRPITAFSLAGRRTALSHFTIDKLGPALSGVRFGISYSDFKDERQEHFPN
jgi:hypothetical protein